MNDLIERLESVFATPDELQMREDSIAELTRLNERVAELEAALTEIASYPHTDNLLWWQKLARSVLTPPTPTMGE